MLYINFTGRHNLSQLKRTQPSISGGKILNDTKNYKPNSDLFNISFAKTKISGRGVKPTNNIKFII